MRHRIRVRAGRRVPAGTAVLVITGAVLMAVPADAHPFGEPQTARISADGSQVRMRWTSPPDDLRLLGGVVGALSSRRTYVFETAPGVEPEPVGQSDAELLASSPRVAAYLTGHLAVRQDGQACEPDVFLDELVDEGALIVFECARPVTGVEIEITMLTDVDEAYRTIAVGEGSTVPDRALYTVNEPVHQWSFQTSSSGMNLIPWGLAGALAAVLAGLGLWALRRPKAAVSWES